MSDIVPTTNLFTEEATHLGDIHSGYARIIPWTTDAASGDTNVCAAGNLHNGYFRDVDGDRAAATQHASAGESDLIAFVWRAHYAIRAKARLAFHWRRVSGAATPVDFRRAAVGVRLQSHATYVNTAGSESVSGGDGYWLVARNVATQPGAKFYLLRVNGGVTTKLAETTVVDVSAWSLREGLWMYVLVSNSGGNPVLICRRAPTSRESVEGLAEVDIFGANITDSSGSKITTAGRCGFALARPKVGSATLATSFEVTDVNTATVVLRDEWIRANYRIGAISAADANGVVGNWLMPYFAGDVGGYGVSRIARDSGANRMKNNGTNTTIDGACAIRASHESTQGRSLSIAHPAGGSYVDVVQIEVRGKNLHAPTGTNADCYRLDLEFQPSNVTVLMRLYAVRGGVGTLFALRTLTNDTSAKVYELSVVNTGGVTAYDGTPIITVKRDGAIVASWTNQFVPGVTLLSDNTFRDARSAAILTGWEQAWRMTASSGTTNRMFFDSWTDTTTPGTLDHDVPGAAVSTEVDGLSGTLVSPHSWYIEERARFPAGRHDYESDHAQTFAIGSRVRRVWSVEMPAATLSEVDALNAFWLTRGSSIPFDWTVEGEAVKGVFVKDSNSVVLIGPGVYRFSFEVEERFA